MDELEQLKKIYLSADIDSEDYEENLGLISEWERDITENENLKSWQEHDVTKKILEQAEESYVELSTQLAVNRTLTDEMRQSIWAKQDAMLWIIRLGAGDAKAALQSIKKKIKVAINATK